MAKKSRGRKRKSQEVVQRHELPGGFWRQVLAVLMIVAAVLFISTWLGAEGTALKAVQDASIKIIGYTTYLLPFILVYLAVMIFRADDNRLDLSVWLASLLTIIWFSGVFGVPSYENGESTGGLLGDALDGFLVKAVSEGPAILIYIVLIVITALFMYAETPAALFRKIASIFKTSKTEEDVENANVMRRAKGESVDAGSMRNFKVNYSDDHDEAEKSHGLLKSFKNNRKEEQSIQPPVVKMPAAVDESKKTALVAVSDPNWKMPPINLLDRRKTSADPGDTHKNAMIIKETLETFGIDVEVEGANVGPRITQYTMSPPVGVKVAKIATYDKDLALNLAKDKIRIEAPIPGTRSVGVEIPNERAENVGLYGLLRADEWAKMIQDKPLAFIVGKDISGKAIVGNLAKMPHLLVAGTTGSGKSVMTNTLITSMLFHNSPSDLKLIIVDPKQVEMAAYEDIPHLLTPVITTVDKALSALKWSVGEMEKRYTLMADERVKNIVDYNAKMAKTGTVVVPDEDGNEQKHNGGKMPYIVVVVDEMADLMMQAGKELETYIVRIAQKGRAAGIHLVLATQRPEVKVVTGLIKANIPGRIAFAVNNGVDSRVMLDQIGAEKLLGSGDMLYLTTEMMGKPKRVQGAYVSDEEIAKITDFLRQQAPPDYNEDVISQPVQIKGMISIDGAASGSSADGDRLRQAAEIAIQNRKLSTSLLQRRMSIGYGKAAQILDDLEAKGVVSAPQGGNKPREVLISSMEEYPD